MQSIPEEAILRRLILRPYRAGAGPHFRLLTYATPRTDWRGQTRIGYRLWVCEGGKARLIFKGEDFSGSPLHCDDSLSTCGALLTFLAARPGDTDCDYFDAYTPAQLEFAIAHGEALSVVAMHLEERG